MPEERTALALPSPDEAVPAAVPLPEVVPVAQGGPVEFERVVPASGNLQVAGKQFWLGPARSGLTVTFWADTSVIHLLVAGTQIKTVRSHLSVADLTQWRLGAGVRPGRPRCRPVTGWRSRWTGS